MACAHPFTPPAHTYFVRGNIYTDPRTLRVPCGWCYCCRRDKQNYMIDRANYEYCKRLTGAFVTFTYDDIWLFRECAVPDVDGRPIFETNDKGDLQLRSTLNYRHVTNFIDSIRHYIKDHKEIQGVMCQPNFSYLYCGEYGELSGEHNGNGRPHFHVLFFGLDFAFCKKIIFERWKYGFIDVLPILDGGIRYVTKYMDKFVSGDLARFQYDFRGKARPRLRASVGFGQGLLWDNIDDIYANYFTYKVRNGRRPISQYWKFLITGNCLSRDPTRDDIFHENPNYTAYKRFMVAERMISANLHRRMNVFSKTNQTEFSLRQAQIREYNIKVQMRNDGCPASDDITQLMNNKFGWIGYNHEKVRRLPTSSQRLLADQYRLSIELKSPYFKKYGTGGIYDV